MADTPLSSGSERLEVLAPDGKILRVDGLTETLFGSWGFVFWLRSIAFSVRAQTAVLGSRDLNAPYLGLSTTPIREVPLGNSILRVFEDKKGLMTECVLSWTWYEMSAGFHGVDVNLTKFLELLEKFRVLESPKGIVFAPIVGLGATIDLVVGINSVEDKFGLAIGPLTQGSVGDLPVGTGEPAAGGELWSSDDRSESGHLVRSAFLLANQTSTTEIVYDGNIEGHREMALTKARMLVASYAAS